MRGFNLIDRVKSAQVHAFNPSEATNTNNQSSSGTGRFAKKLNKLKSFGSNLKSSNRVAINEVLLPYGLPSTSLLEPSIEPHLKPINFVESLSDLYHRFKTCPQSDKSSICIEQYSLLCCLGDLKLLRRSLRAAREYSDDVHSKVVLSAWLRFEKNEDDIDLVGESSMSSSCSGHILECPKAALVHGYNCSSFIEHCHCLKDHSDVVNVPEFLDEDDIESDVSFCIGNEEIKCVRQRMGDLSMPFKAMLFGDFKESKTGKIDFSHIGISVKGMKAMEIYSRTKRVDLFSPDIVLELLSFSNRFCCEEMKSSSDSYLASLVNNIDDALVLIEYGLEEMANILVASCLQVLFRDLPNILYNYKVMKFFVSSEAKKRLALSGHSSFLLYYFLSRVAMEESMVSNLTVRLLERLTECATNQWQKALAFHQLGCAYLQRREYKNAAAQFEAAVEEGHVYSMAGLARTKFKQGQRYLAYKLISSLISQYKPSGWMYQERSLYNIGKEKKIIDLNTATELDPTLSFPYRYRAVLEAEEKQIQGGILEIDKIIGFKLLPDCLELRAWFFIALEDYENALRDIRALLTLEPDYMMFYRKVSGNDMIDLLSKKVLHQWSQADCWINLYDRWSSVDDIGSLAVIHQMLINDPKDSVLRFRQSLLLLRLNCQKAAIRSLQLALVHSSSQPERLVYEGWILYDMGHHEEALAKAEKSISIKRSFEAFFLKAYVLADTSLNPESFPYVIQQLEEALKCPSDGLRKGQALNNLGSIYMDHGKLDLAADCYTNALDIHHARAHQGLARVYHLHNQRKAAYDEMTKMIEKAKNNASAYEKRSEYCDREMAKNDLDTATRLDPLRTYPYRYRAAVLMDEQREIEAIEELSKAIDFRPDLQMLNLRAAFYESMGDLNSALRDCEAALCLDPNHSDTVDLYNRARDWEINQQME